MQEHATSGVRFELRELIALRGHVAALVQHSQRRSADALAGAHASPFRGRGMEYAESRPYAAGDDVRHIDWRVTARTGRAHTKLFQPERERTTAVVYDCSASLAFGTRRCFKSVQAARLAALMLWLARRDGHRVAAAGASASRELLPPLGGRRGVLRALDALVRWQPAMGQQTDGKESGHVAAAIDGLQRALRPGSQVLCLLDPCSVDERVASTLARLRQHHDLAVCLLVDPFEISPPVRAIYRIGNGQDVGSLHLETKLAQVQWRAHFLQQHTAARERLARAGARVAMVATDADPVDALGRLLRGQSESGLERAS